MLARSFMFQGDVRDMAVSGVGMAGDRKPYWRRVLKPALRRPAVRVLFALVSLGVLAAGIWFYYALPEPLFKSPLSPVVYARDGQLLGARLAGDRQWRFPARAELPQRFVSALVEFEDRRFFDHPGVDPLAGLRALWSNLRAGRVVSGASTLSMQVVRIASDNPPRTLGEKLREALLAVRLELRYDKHEILALYAQHAPFGGNIVGVETAAWRYFGRAAAELSWAEAATLAVLPNSPALIHPGRSRERLREKRDRLLRALHTRGLLDALDLRLALAEPLPAEARPLPRLAPHLLDTLSQRMIAPLGGFHSTLDAGLQHELSQLIERQGRELAAQGVHNAAAIVIDNRDLRVLAYLGNTRRDNTARRGYAMDLIQRPRSSGSVLKPMLYALMLEAGELLPDTLVADVPTQINGYVPENYDRSYRGAVSAREALALSLNIPAVRLLREHGVARFHAGLRAMGMRSLRFDADHYGLTLILGGAETSLWEVGQFYANLAAIAQHPGRSADYCPPQLLIDQPTPCLGPAEYGPGAAWLTLQAMAEVNRPGIESYWRNFSSSRQVAWKTGTSFGLRDAWAVGSTPRYTVAVWAGNADGEGVAGLSGTQTAAPLLFAILNRLPDSGWFVTPVQDLKQVSSCQDGFLPRAGCRETPQWAPFHSHFARGSPYQRSVQLDPTADLRVHAGCENLSAMRSQAWFQLPPTMEHYYRRQHPEYRTLPPWRPDCRAGAESDDNPIGLLYPQAGSVVYIPAELDGQRSRVIVQAVHRDPDAVLHWHLDGDYLGSSRDFHQREILANAGEHQLTLVDQDGHRLTRRFSVLSKHGSR